MDIFEVLTAISKRKKAFMHSGVDEHEAMKKAEIDISKEYHISLFDIKRLAGQRSNRTEARRHRRSYS